MKIFVVLTVLSNVYVFSQQNYMVNCEWNTSAPEVISFADREPEFPGGVDSLFVFIEDHLYIPKDEQKQPVEGIVYIRMIIDQYGQIRDPDVLKSTDQRLDRYALALIKKCRIGIRAKKPARKFVWIIVYLLNLRNGRLLSL